MTREYRVETIPTTVYVVRCDCCGREERIFFDPSSLEHFYCHKCKGVCLANDTFRRHRVMKGAKVVGFRISPGGPLLGLVLQKGEKKFEVYTNAVDEVSETTEIKVSPGCRYSRDGYMYREKPSKRAPG